MMCCPIKGLNLPVVPQPLYFNCFIPTCVCATAPLNKLGKGSASSYPKVTFLTQILDWTFTQEEEKVPGLDSRLQNQSEEWKQKLKIAFSISNFLKPRHLIPGGGSEFISLTDCKVNVGEVWLLSLGWLVALLYALLLSFHYANPLASISIVHSYNPQALQ